MPDTDTNVFGSVDHPQQVLFCVSCSHLYETSFQLDDLRECLIKCGATALPKAFTDKSVDANLRTLLGACHVLGNTDALKNDSDIILVLNSLMTLIVEMQVRVECTYFRKRCTIIDRTISARSQRKNLSLSSPSNCLPTRLVAPAGHHAPAPLCACCRRSFTASSIRIAAASISSTWHSLICARVLAS